MVEQSGRTLPTRVQILVLALFSEFFRIYWRYALSGKRAKKKKTTSIMQRELHSVAMPAPGGRRPGLPELGLH
jgi:hypothetical protein